MTNTDTPANMQKAVRWHPPAYDVRVEWIPIPEVQHPDDAIVKVKYTGLCGSDLHVYRGHGVNVKVHTIGHEFVGEVVALGFGFGPHASGRPSLYASLQVGHKVVCPFSTNCGECHVCRMGYTGRCAEGVLVGCDLLDGAQAQYVRIPKAGGTLYDLDDPSSWNSKLSISERQNALAELKDQSLLLLADILPTGLFAAVQAINHPKLQTMVTGLPWPYALDPSSADDSQKQILTASDKLLVFAIIGLGPVGICTAVSLLDILATKKLPYKVVAIDPLDSRRDKMQAVYDKIGSDGKGEGELVVASIEEAKSLIVGNTSAISLAYELVRPFGAITSVGVHGEPPVPFTGRQLYNKNVSLDFGRCPARSMFPPAFDLLVKRQDVFGSIGEAASLIERLVPIDQSPEAFSQFDQGNWGKVVIDPWM